MLSLRLISHNRPFLGLEKKRDEFMAELQRLAKQRPRESDDKYDAEIARLDGALNVARDDLVRLILHGCCFPY